MGNSLVWHGVSLLWVYNRLLPKIIKRIQCPHIAFDVLHDALIRFAMAKNPQRHQQPEAYLFTIVQNLIIDQHKHNGLFVSIDATSEGNESGDYGVSVNPQFAESFSPSPEYLIDIKQRLALLQKIIDSLPAKCREVFWLFRIEGVPQKVIAEQLGISLNMVEKHVIRALVDLRVAKSMLEN
jgi:RNA polymerase sigma factor (sigma-70 family)